MALRPGSIVVFSNNAKDYFSLLQKGITHGWIEGVSPKKFGPGDKTHSAMIWYPTAGYDAIFEAFLCSTIDPFSNHTVDTKYWVFDPIGFTDAQIKEALEETYIKYSATSYGFLELPWFAFRFFMEKFHKDVRKKHNWFPGGNICSQVAWNYMYSLGAASPELRARLDEWRSTTFHSSDTFTVLTSLPNLFKLTAQQ